MASTIDLIYPKKAAPKVIPVKKLTEMTTLDLMDILADFAAKIDKALEDNLEDIALATRQIAPVPEGRFDITTWDNCYFWA